MPSSSCWRFLSTPSARRATLDFAGDRPGHGNFYPRPPRGGRRFCSRRDEAGQKDFYPRPPRGGRRADQPDRHGHAISIHALREEGDLEQRQPQQRRLISIHALREEGDQRPSRAVQPFPYFYPRPPRGGRHTDRPPISRPRPISIHALREEGDFSRKSPGLTLMRFLSTPSARRATSPHKSLQITNRFLSTPSARRATSCRFPCQMLLSFLSTPSARRATLLSISMSNAPFYFYPRPPRGGRPGTAINHDVYIQFLSTPSARRATQGQGWRPPYFGISIHALREEGDQR